MYIKSGLYVNLSGTAIITLIITVSSEKLGAVFCIICYNAGDNLNVHSY
jgi:hypothetical protein